MALTVELQEKLREVAGALGDLLKTSQFPGAGFVGSAVRQWAPGLIVKAAEAVGLDQCITTQAQGGSVTLDLSAQEPAPSIPQEASPERPRARKRRS